MGITLERQVKLHLFNKLKLWFAKPIELNFKLNSDLFNAFHIGANSTTLSPLDSTIKIQSHQALINCISRCTKRSTDYAPFPFHSGSAKLARPQSPPLPPAVQN